MSEAWITERYEAKAKRKRSKLDPRMYKHLGMVSGVLELLEIETKWSPYFDRDYRTGWCMVRCLACGKDCEFCQGEPFRMRLARVSVGGKSPQSRVSCGCSGRIRKPRKVNFDKAPGHPPADLTDIVFGQLEPITYKVGEGWVCRCTCSALCVATVTELTRGKRTACSHCKPQEWSRKSGGQKGVRRPPRLWYLRPDAASPTPGPA